MKRNTSDVLRQLRSLFANQSHVPERVSAYIIPSEDAHHSEYIAACDERRAFISGFSGSAGIAVVTNTSAALWTDGRYFIQADKQMDENWTLMKMGMPGTPSVCEWLSQELPEGEAIGVDPYLFSHSDFSAYAASLEPYNLRLLPITDNLVDVVWGSARPPAPKNKLMVLDVQLTGESSTDKVARIREVMRARHASALLVSALDEVAWLFNLRGTDIAYNPVFFSYALITTNDLVLYVDNDKLEADVLAALRDVQVKNYDEIQKDLDLLRLGLVGKMWVPGGTSYALASIFPRESVLSAASPLDMMKAKKNPVELQGMRDAHVRDSAAHCEFLFWLESQMAKGNKHLTEVQVADQFLNFRKQQDRFKGLSFSTISAVGPNAAIAHYDPCAETDTPLSKSQIYLVDSGGQYLDGTTDITRTIMFCDPPAFIRDCFTRVLKGHIALADLIFPVHMSGYRLDSLARVSLWDVGLDFKHGTGHGIGHFLNVHEGPSGFHWRQGRADEGIEAGMVITVEPGYYHDGEFGIRIENAYEMVYKVGEPFKPETFLGMEPLTLVPISTRMIDPALLSKSEIDWLNKYHERVEAVVGPELKRQGKKDVFDWLTKQTLPLN